MKTYRVKMEDRASADMAGIHDYIADALRSPISAMEQYDRIADAVLSLNILPNRCPLLDCEPERSQGVRMLLVDHYAILYTVSGDTVTVLRVLYSASDLLSSFRWER